MKVVKCPLCNKELKSDCALRAHHWRVHTEKGKAFKVKKHVAWNKGLTKETSPLIKKMGEKISKTNKGMVGHKLTEEHKESLRKHILERYANGWEVKCGRAKKYDYNSLIAGDIKVDGRWELAVACFLDLNHFNWKRNKKRFPYINLKGKKSTYCPDFWIEDWNTYLEVKGYETDLDRCKWKQFNEPLLIWKDVDLIERYIINKFGEVAEVVKALVC